jgi:hypothetical protein
MTSAASPTAATVLSGWQDVLAAQHAAIYGYGLVGPHLSNPNQIAAALALQEAHRDTRDALMSQIAAAGATPVAASPLYPPPQAVTDAVGAQRWALTLEESCEVAYRYVLTISASVAAGAQQQTRQQAVAGLSTAALAAATWRQLLSPANPTEPFPGQDPAGQ